MNTWKTKQKKSPCLHFLTNMTPRRHLSFQYSCTGQTSSHLSLWWEGAYKGQRRAWVNFTRSGNRYTPPPIIYWRWKQRDCGRRARDLTKGIAISQLRCELATQRAKSQILTIERKMIEHNWFLSLQSLLYYTFKTMLYSRSSVREQLCMSSPMSWLSV